MIGRVWRAVRRSDEIDELQAELRRAPLRHRSVDRHAGHAAAVRSAAEPDDRQLVQRIIAAYQSASKTDLGARDSLWLGPLAEPKRPIHDALLRGDVAAVTETLRRPATSALFYGFENAYAATLPRDATLANFWDIEAPYDALRRLAEAMGASRVENPENCYYGQTPEPETPESLLEKIEAVFGVPFDFPNPFPGERGLATARGVATYRAVQALFQAWRIADLVKKGRGDPRVLEIGAGLGRTAYYARRLGIRDYTIIDIPMTGVAQAYFLGRTLGDDAVRLFGEDGAMALRILPPAAFLDGHDRYDLVVNVDSMTELARDTAQSYWDQIRRRAGAFLSINHETNPFTVRDLYTANGLEAIRAPAWLRRGYVEELIRF